MPLHFSDAEMLHRRGAATRAVADAGFDALLMFKQESMYWLTGYDTFGFAMFQCLVLTADGRVALLTRRPDKWTAEYTSNIDDVRVWVDAAGVDPARQLVDLLSDLGLRRPSLGIELDSFGLTASNWLLLEGALDGYGTWRDASTVVQELRRVKSPQEISYIRRAAELADDAWDAAVAASGPGADESDILADMQDVVLRGGGDYAGNEIIIGSGPGALMVRYSSGRRRLDANDQLTLEWCGVQRRYHAAMMRTIVIGDPGPRHVSMHSACVDALEACEATIRPGAALHDVFAAHASALDGAGHRNHRFNACGYGMGAVYAPIWVDWPMIHEGNELAMAAGQAFFLHMILIDEVGGLAMTLGHTVLVTEFGCERLSRSSLELVGR